MKYLFAIAQNQEINFNLLKTQFKGIFLQTNKYFLINYNKNQYFFKILGIGKVNSALIINFILKNQIKNLINIGVCGSLLTPMLNQIYLIEKCFYLDVDVRQFNYKFGQLPLEPEYFLTNNLLNPKMFKQYKLFKHNLATMDSFAEYKNFSKTQKTFIQQHHIHLFDMECTALAQMSHKYNLNFNAIKLVSDLIKKEKCFLQYQDNTELLKNKLTKFIIDWIYSA